MKDAIAWIDAWQSDPNFPDDGGSMSIPEAMHVIRCIRDEAREEYVKPCPACSAAVRLATLAKLHLMAILKPDFVLRKACSEFTQAIGRFAGAQHSNDCANQKRVQNDDPACTTCGHAESDHRPQIDGSACGAAGGKRCICKRPNQGQPECRCPSSLIAKGLHTKTCPQRPNQERK